MMQHIGKKRIKENSVSENCEDNLRHVFKLGKGSQILSAESNDNYPEIEE